MELIRIFIAEDEEDQLEIYTDAIEDFNKKDKKVKIEPVIATSKEEAIDILNSDFFDAVFIDLNLSSGSTGEETAEGNELVEYIRENMRYPVFVVTGKPNEHIRELAKSNSFISLHEKDEGENLTDNLLEKVKKLYLTGITKILGAQGKLDKHLDDIFWNHLSLTMPYWLELDCGECDLEKIISRYILTHLYEYMEKPDTSEKIYYDAAEMYIYPRIKTDFSPGDIIQNGKDFFLLLTPACTVAKECDQFQLAKIIPLKEQDDLIKLKKTIIETATKIDALEEERGNLSGKEYAEKKLSLEIEDEKLKNKLKGISGSYIGNNKGDRYHFLPKLFCFEEEKLVDFKQIMTIDNASLASFSPEMTINIHFFKDIQARFAIFYARQGSPDFNTKILSKSFIDDFI